MEMTPASDEIAERDREAAIKFSRDFWDDQTSSAASQYFKDNQRTFLAGVEYCKRTYGTFDQAIELLRSLPGQDTKAIFEFGKLADWLSNNKPRGV